MATTARRHTTITYWSICGYVEAISRRGHLTTEKALRAITGDTDRSRPVHIRHYTLPAAHKKEMKQWHATNTTATPSIG